jgi:hypothetical protein
LAREVLRAKAPETAGDIDLLIIHDATVDASRMREALADLCALLPIHLTILTRHEERERGFRARAGICQTDQRLIAARVVPGVSPRSSTA